MIDPFYTVLAVRGSICVFLVKYCFFILSKAMFVQFYDQSKSSTFKNIGQQFDEFNYTYGITFQDTISIGGISIPNQVLGQALSFDNNRGWENNVYYFIID
jgi:hypothetical protein